MGDVWDLFGDRMFMPHGHCYLWRPGMLWLQLLSNLAIGLAYMAITATLFYLVRRSRDIPFQWMYVAFGVFIVTCGFTHFMDVVVIWEPAYWLDGGLRAITAVASVGTAILLPPLVPKAIALTEAARLSHERGVRLEEANRELGVLLDRSKELEQLKTQFFANVSHELRTPLALILGPLEKQLARPELAPEDRRDLDVAARNARTLLRHVNDLLEVSRLEAGRAAPAHRRIDLARRVRRAAAHFEALAAERGLALAVEAPDALEVDADPDQLDRVLINLVSNAVKFTPDGGRVRVGLRGDGDAVVLEVADSGPGIRPDDRERIFERFRQLDGGTTRRFGGTGLGLAIVRDLVTLHGGAIRVDQASEGGARFTVELPRRAPEGVEVARDVSGDDGGRGADLARTVVDELRGRVEAREGVRGGDARARVLVVDDNDEMRRFIADSLADTYQVETAADGEEGLARALAAPPDLVLTDVMMPRRSGDELVRALRERDALAGVPIVLLTARADDELRVRLLREGAQDYLTKPFSVDELRARVANLVTAKRAREVLQRELDVQLADLELLAGEVSERKHELEAALDAMRVARAQAEAASRAKSSFLGLVSHELRTPITALELQLERLKVDPAVELGDAQRGLVDRMTRQTRRLADLVDGLLTYARVETGRVDPRPQRFALDALVAEIAADHQAAARGAGLTLEVDAAPDLPPLSSDPELVRLIVANLVGNAVRHTRQGAVAVRTTREGERFRVAVRDTGPGIRPEDRVRIFQPFEQLEPIAGKHGAGVGLGLAIVRELATALGGTIELASEVGAGSTFTVTLPELAS